MITENTNYAFTMGTILGILAWQTGKWLYWRNRTKSRICKVSDEDPVKNGEVELE